MLPRNTSSYVQSQGLQQFAQTAGRATAPGTGPPLVSSIPEEDRLKIWLTRFI